MSASVGAFLRFGLIAHLSLRALIAPVVFGVTALAQDKDGRVLLVRHTYQPGWLLPGGGVARGELPEAAVIRELKEEVGFIRGGNPELIRIYNRKAGWATNVTALYRVREVEIQFRRNLEIREAAFYLPNALPDGTPSATRRRIDEVLGSSAPQ